MYVSKDCFESLTVQPTPTKRKNSVKDKRRRRLEEMQCLAPRLRRGGTTWLGRQLESSALPALCWAGSSRRKPDSTHLHQNHLQIIQPFQNRLIKTLLLSLHFCLWI